MKEKYTPKNFEKGCSKSREDSKYKSKVDKDGTLWIKYPEQKEFRKVGKVDLSNGKG